ncbi:hypothetical protein R1flu_003219 [Riccia fluitans]|uniref:Uncharacterized protein n=1 Tax=Riccia fluitans TaxID=41844 RepID=A0ABD1YC48_9MARC
MHGINLHKMVRRCHWPKPHPASTRTTDLTSSLAARLWHRHHQQQHDHHHQDHAAHWDLSDSDSEDDESSKWIPRDVPAGCVVVYVGQERRRYVIDYHYLSHPLFKALLQRSAEEYGFHHEGGLLIACEVVLFEHLLRVIENHVTTTHYPEIQKMMGYYGSPCPTSEALSRPLL